MASTEAWVHTFPSSLSPLTYQSAFAFSFFFPDPGLLLVPHFRVFRTTHRDILMFPLRYSRTVFLFVVAGPRRISPVYAGHAVVIPK